MSPTKPAQPQDDAIPDPPDDLKHEGRALWFSILDDLDLDQHELSLLRAAARTADRLEDIAQELDGAPLTVSNFKGDEVANPLLVEQRMQAASHAKLLASLRLPTGLSEDGGLKRPQRRGSARGPYGLRAVGR